MFGFVFVFCHIVWGILFWGNWMGYHTHFFVIVWLCFFCLLYFFHTIDIRITDTVFGGFFCAFCLVMRGIFRDYIPYHHTTIPYDITNLFVSFFGIFLMFMFRDHPYHTHTNENKQKGSYITSKNTTLQHPTKWITQQRTPWIMPNA